MKYLLFAFLICSHIPSIAQNNNDTLVGTRIWRTPSLPTENGVIVYTDTITLTKGYNKKRLRNNAKEWISYNLTKDKKDISVDTVKNTISGIGYINYNQGTMEGTANRNIVFHYHIETMNGGYSYRFDRIGGNAGSRSNDYNIMYNEDKKIQQYANHGSTKERYEMLSDLHSYMTLMITGLQKAMLK